MVYQGTVFGPGLWNVYYGDSRAAIQACGFKEIIYADDLNCFRLFRRETSNRYLHVAMREVQSELHARGDANQVIFDASKEHFLIASHVDPEGDPVTVLGIEFDGKLLMGSAIHKCASESSWKIRSIVRTRRFYCDRDLIIFFKSHVLSFIEYRTPAFYHAATTTLRPLDRILEAFLREVGVSAVEALLQFNLAPLSTRRDIAMLGLIHRCVLGKGPPHFAQFFTLDRNTRLANRRHSKHLQDYRVGRLLAVVARSALGLIAVYNLLPQRIVDRPSVSSFQSALTELVRHRAEQNFPNWESTFSPRMSMTSHPLIEL